MTLPFVPLILFLFPLAYSPGPGNLFFAAIGARSGLRHTLPALCGYHLATWGVTLGLGLGLSSILQALPGLFQVLKWAGALYVFYLAFKFLRAGQLTNARTAPRARFVDGVALLALNPKAYVIIALMFSQFLPVSTPSAVAANALAATHFLPVLWITTIFTFNNLIAFLLWAALGDVLARQFRSAGTAQRLNTVFGVLLAAVGLWMLFG